MSLDESPRRITEASGSVHALRNRTAMVLFALEQSLGAYVRENANDPNDLQAGQSGKREGTTSQSVPALTTVVELIQGTYIAEIIDLAITVARFSSDREPLMHLKRLADALRLYDIRNAVCHPNREFPECYWYRLCTLATDPAIDILQFRGVRRAFEAALANRIELPEDEWFNVFAFSIPNNLPETTEHEITGLVGREKERVDFIKRLKNKKLNLIAVVGPGGTGKTALVLDVLRELSLDPSTLDWADEFLYVTAKTESLTKDGPVPLFNPIDSIEAVKAAVRDLLLELHPQPVGEESENEVTFSDTCKQHAERRLLLCIDNLETLLRDHAEAFDEFYSEIPPAWRVLVTSRVTVNSATVISLHQMKPDAAKILAKHYLSKRGGTPIDFEVLGQLVEKAECNPLAIRVCLDAYVAGLSLENALSQARDGLLGFSYKNLMHTLPPESNNVLECLFAANSSLPRSEIAFFLDSNPDDVAVGLTGLLRTSLILRIPSTTSESYSLSSSIRELLLRNPLSDATRSRVFSRLAQRREAVEQLEKAPKYDALDKMFVSQDASDAAKHRAFEVFRALRTRSAVAVLADLAWAVRQDIASGAVCSLTYRLGALLYLEMNDSASAIQILEQGDKVNVLDPSSRLLLAEQVKLTKDYRRALEVAEPLFAAGWLTDGRAVRQNLVRLARVTWLLRIWLEDYSSVADETSDWRIATDLRVTKACLHASARRRMFENRVISDSEFEEHCTEILDCLSDIFVTEGYIGFVAHEAFNCIDQFAWHVGRQDFTQFLRVKLRGFLESNLAGILSNDRSASLEDPIVRAEIGKLCREVGIAHLIDQPVEDDAEDDRIAEYGYVSASIYHWPLDEFKERKTFCFARDAEGREYHISRRSVSAKFEFYDMQVGDRVLVKPRADVDEGRAIPAQDVIPQG
jgi:hypothetical protein